MGLGRVIAFHVLLLPFGFGVWLYAVPALVVLVLLARHDLAAPTWSSERPVPTETPTPAVR